MSDRFEVRPVDAYVLYKDGKPVVDGHGQPRVWLSSAEIARVVDDWERVRAPTHAELQAMSDDELRRRAGGGREN